MSLTAGSKVGPYEIIAPLGAGGMGEVYRARDTRLDRNVAIKALPEHLVGDPDRLARLLREAKALASLNHPGIAAIYGLEEADGRRYLVLECVEGQTLAQRLQLGAVGVEEALDSCRQVAEALENAHEKGVIHRDIKPGNVMLTPEGKVKVLDFGLARTFDGSVLNSGMNFAPDSPTMTSPAYVHSPTIPGVILGSAGYMSPEQARGKPVDKRSDIFSFGCVFYECLTGKRPFDGESTGDIIAKTLEREPDFTLLPSQTPMRVRDLLKQMLEKNPKRRLRDIGDAAIVLDRSIADHEWALPAWALQPASRRWGVPGVLCAAAVLAAASFAGWFAGARPPL